MADLTRRPGRRLVEALARRRVALGFAAAVATLVLANPSWTSWGLGLVVAALGEAGRVWAAGHLEKSREVTRSGPYRFTRHPLYVGSSVIALGIVIASRSVIVTVLTTVYMAATIAAAIHTEESFLRQRFGATYDEYRAARAQPMARRFSWKRAMRNREHRAIVGMVVGFALLALRILVPV